jgi:hypothetical protein
MDFFSTPKKNGKKLGIIFGVFLVCGNKSTYNNVKSLFTNVLLTPVYLPSLVIIK